MVETTYLCTASTIHKWRMWESNPSLSLQMKCAAHHTPSPMQYCLHCNNQFTPPESEVKRGNGKFCSRKCSSTHAAQKRSSARPLNATCALCGKSFRKSPSKLKELNFCCRSHKDKAQRLQHRILEIPHYSDGAFVEYRKLALEHYGEVCQRCGYNIHAMALDVHYKDRNRRNNDLSNLEVVCRNCHAIEHFGTETSVK